CQAGPAAFRPSALPGVRELGDTRCRPDRFETQHSVNDRPRRPKGDVSTHLEWAGRQDSREEVLVDDLDVRPTGDFRLKFARPASVDLVGHEARTAVGE